MCGDAGLGGVRYYRIESGVWNVVGCMGCWRW